MTAREFADQTDEASSRRATQRKGDIATTQAVATLTAMGWDVSIPVTESAAYDLVVDTGSMLARIQCKFSSTRKVGVRNIHSNAKGYVVKKAIPGAYDWLYVLRPDGTEFLIKECLSGRNSIVPKEEHQIGAVAESG